MGGGGLTATSFFATELCRGDIGVRNKHRGCMMSDRLELLKNTADEFELLFDAGAVTWVDVVVDDLPLKTVAYLSVMLDEAGVRYKVAEQVLNGSYFFKLDDPLVGFLHHDPVLGTHMWVDAPFKNGLDNQAVFNYLVALKVDRGVLSMDAVNKFNGVTRVKKRNE